MDDLMKALDDLLTAKMTLRERAGWAGFGELAAERAAEKEAERRLSEALAAAIDERVQAATLRSPR